MIIQRRPVFELTLLILDRYQTSKVLNYLRSPITVPYFTFFIIVWTYLRHYINLRILYSILTDFRTVGPYELNWETQQYKCWIAQYISFALLASLQSINLFWLYLILRVAANVVFKKEEKDVRSDDEDDEAEEMAKKVDAKKVGPVPKKEDKESNGNATEGHGSNAGAVVEGKKSR